MQGKGGGRIQDPEETAKAWGGEEARASLRPSGHFYVWELRFSSRNPKKDFRYRRRPGVKGRIQGSKLVPLTLRPLLALGPEPVGVHKGLPSL